MTDLSVSVIVVSRQRPDALLLCLTGIEQLDHPAFEVIVVADPAGLTRLSQAGFDGRIKTVAYDEPNISVARNLGIGVAGGDVIAFIDDDAVPEPTWLTHLSAPFAQGDVAAAGGSVLGRNGITFQNRGRRVDATGQHTPVAADGDAPVILKGAPGNAVKTEGTNCAFRAEILRQIGGFDPAYRFYLDETDVDLRLAELGARTAIVPLAQVHHGYAASDRRGASRMPKTLIDIGRSQAYFLRRFAPDRLDFGIDDMRSEQRRRLLRFMVAGVCEPRDVNRLLRTLENGFAEGLVLDQRSPAALAAKGEAFRKFEGRRSYARMTVLFARTFGASAARSAARAAVVRGDRVSLFVFSATALYHRVRFTADGYWEQIGGLAGRSERSGPLVKWTTFKQRLQAEVARVRKVRIGETAPTGSCEKWPQS